MIINRITKLIGIGAFLCCSLTIAAQKLRSVSAHSNMHHDLIASQRDMSDQIKVQETREFMNELLEDEQEPEIDIYTEGWNSNLVNPYAHQAVPNNVRIDVSDYAMPVPGFITSPTATVHDSDASTKASTSNSTPATPCARHLPEKCV